MGGGERHAAERICALQGVGGERGGGRDTFGSLAWAAGCVCREQGTQESWADGGGGGCLARDVSIRYLKLGPFQSGRHEAVC